MDISLLMQDAEEQVFKIPFLDGHIDVLYGVPDEVQKVVEKATEQYWDKKHQPRERFNVITYRRLLGRRFVRGWDNITVGGQPYGYSEENCDLLMTRWADFANCVDRSIVDLQGLMEAKKREETKK